MSKDTRILSAIEQGSMMPPFTTTAAYDNLTGSSGRAWFFTNLERDTRDAISDDHANEISADIDLSSRVAWFES